MFLHRSYIYSISWEDFDVDDSVMMFKRGEHVLTLTGGGCNALNIAMKGVHVYCVDFNPAQNALLELKIQSAKRGYDSLWSICGQGDHQPIDPIIKNMDERSKQFWIAHKHYIEHSSIYEHGGMGFLTRLIKRFHLQNTLTYSWFQRYNWLINTFITFFTLTRLTFPLCWYLLGIPPKQLHLIQKHDKRSLIDYKDSIINVFKDSSLSQNMYYSLVLNGHFSPHNCPEYLKHKNYIHLANNLHNISWKTCSFNERLKERKYDKVILMDHLDWQSEEAAAQVCELLKTQCNRMLLLRSASLHPPYIKQLENAGFIMLNVNNHKTHIVCDRINMYASTWVGIKN